MKYLKKPKELETAIEITSTQIYFLIASTMYANEKCNKPRTAKVGAISKAQNLKGGPFGLCETPAGCKKFKKN